MMESKKSKMIYQAILANGQMLVDCRDIEDVISRCLKNNVSFKVDATESIGIYKLVATKVPVNQIPSYNPV
jgi:hypothetical protein